MKNIAQMFEHKRDYVNSLEKLFRDKETYGFDDFITEEFELNPDSDFYDITLGIADELSVPVNDAFGNFLNLDPNSKTLDKDLEEYIYNLLLDNNTYD